MILAYSERLLPAHTSRLFDWFALAALGSLGCLGVSRALILFGRGIRVVVMDPQRSRAQVVADVLFAGCFGVWVYEIIAYTAPLPFHLVPQVWGSVLVDAVPLKAIGAVFEVSGLVIYHLALRAIGDSWRIGIDRATPGGLVIDGIFAWTRNPIYIALELIAFGTFLVLGRLLFLAFAILSVGIFHCQIRREERFLAHTFSDEYRRYCARVARYATWR